jgi:hypothetical protein
MGMFDWEGRGLPDVLFVFSKDAPGDFSPKFEVL